MLKKRLTRRSFSSKVLASSSIPLLGSLPPVSAKEANVRPDDVRFDNGIESTVQLIENTPRGSLIETLAGRIKLGLSYRQVLAALLLAGVRNVQPRPSVGFKFHCVLVINSCHLASLSGPDSDRWLPLLWAADYFKSSQADEARQSKWRMAAVDESKIPKATQAKKLFIEAMDNWDTEKADVATAALCRHFGSTEVFNLFARYAARDYRSIGHKAIYLANSWRTLQVIGWQFSEPVMRSLAFALLNHRGEPNPAKSDLSVDRPWKDNGELVTKIPATWLSGELRESTSLELVGATRHGDPKSVAEQAAKAIQSGVSPRSIWDGIFLSAGELLMRQPGIIGLHGLTTANAMFFLWKTAESETLRKRILLQACSFNPMFRESAKARGELGSHSVSTLIDSTKESSFESNKVQDVISAISGNRMEAATRLLAFLTAGGNGHKFVDESRKVLFQKGRDAHDYKFSSAVLEDYANVSPAWREVFLAMSVFNLKGSTHRDNQLYKRIKNNL